MIAGSQLRDTQGEMLSVEGADISDLMAGRGRLNDNHGKGFYNSIGKVTGAKKIFKEEDCENDRHKYYWSKVKAPFIYVKGELYDNDDHPNAKAAAAIIRNIHKADTPLKIKASVEGGVVSRGVSDSALLARTKIHSVALTFTPANNATLVEPISLDKSYVDEVADMALIKSVVHLAETDVPNFRYVTRHASADKVIDNTNKIKELALQLGFENFSIPDLSHKQIIDHAAEDKIINNVKKINEISKALMAGYGGAGIPTSMVGGGVIQTQSLKGDKKKVKKDEGFKFIVCDNCGHEQIHHKYQVKCRQSECGKSFSLEKLVKLLD